MAGAQNLVLNAMGFLGIPYRFGGATPEAGFDCSGFVQYVFRQAAGLMLPRSSFDQIRQGIAVAREELQVGDLVFFNTMRATASHVGIYIGENRFTHAPSRGKTVEIVDIEKVSAVAHKAGIRVIVDGAPNRKATEYSIHLKSITRPADGWSWPNGRRRR